jgi:3-methylcrotonyl-CoA carboxylase alpha subunit
MRIGATTRTVQRWIAIGRLPARRVGGRWRVASDALDAFLDTGARRGSVQPPARVSAGRDLPAVPLRGASPIVIRRLFIANRGEIARRIERTATRLGMAVIVPATDDPGGIDLLDAGAVVEAAVASSADAVHPGFGFLAESAAFAQAVLDAGLTWVGPPPTAIRAMGDKAAARRLAARLGLPVVPGYDAADQSDGALGAAAAQIGYPLLLKPAAGGGGKGMRIVRTGERLADEIAAARREASGAFGDDRLILERYVEAPRHVEVQVLFDRHGRGIHLGERDCSTQRRHQKVLEETPSPAVSPSIRTRLTELALEIASAVGYESAGTVECLLTDRGEVLFLEMNTRLQVEHPVTELVTGIDLVEEQLRIAAGEPLRIEQGDADRRRAHGGHAIEVRLYAEDAESGFLPATGRVAALTWPSGPGIRVDAGIDPGSEVGSRFDPMLAKIAAHGDDRRAALARLTRALDETLVLGLTTNLRFLRWLVREPAIRDGQMRVDSLERIWPPADWAARTAIPEAAWRAAARRIVGRSPRSGWRLNAPRRVRLASDSEERTIELEGRPLESDAPAALAEPSALTEPSAVLEPDGRAVDVDVAGRSVRFRLAPRPDVDRAARAASAAHHGGRPVDVVSPMPGAIVAVHRRAGDSLDAGEPIATLEAMKMEHAVVAPRAGRIAELAVRPGDQVSRGQLLATLEP